jgi:hypothetical protein
MRFELEAPPEILEFNLYVRSGDYGMCATCGHLTDRPSQHIRNAHPEYITSEFQPNPEGIQPLLGRFWCPTNHTIGTFSGMMLVACTGAISSLVDNGKRAQLCEFHRTNDPLITYYPRPAAL